VEALPHHSGQRRRAKMQADPEPAGDCCGTDLRSHRPDSTTRFGASSNGRSSGSFEAKTAAGHGTWASLPTSATTILPDALPCPADETLTLAQLPTRLAAAEPVIQERLINWGYAICDAAMRKWVDSSLGEAEQVFPIQPAESARARSSCLAVKQDQRSTS